MAEISRAQFGLQPYETIFQTRDEKQSVTAKGAELNGLRLTVVRYILRKKFVRVGLAGTPTGVGPRSGFQPQF